MRRAKLTTINRQLDDIGVVSARNSHKLLSWDPKLIVGSMKSELSVRIGPQLDGNVVECRSDR
jgi:hypothetical protein